MVHPCNETWCSHYKNGGLGRSTFLSCLPWYLVFLEKFELFSILLALDLRISFWTLPLQKHNSALVMSPHILSGDNHMHCYHFAYYLWADNSQKYLCSTDFFSWMTQKHLKFWKQTLDISPKICFPLPLFIHLGSTQSTHLSISKTWGSTFIPCPECIWAACKLKNRNMI